MLRIHTELGLIPRGTPSSPILYPFCGAPADDPLDPSHGRYEALLREGPGFLALAPLETADIVVFPVGWEHAQGDAALVESAHRLAEVAREHGKPFVIFYWSDDADEVPVAPSVVFRTSLYRSLRPQRAARELAMPAWSEDFVEHYQDGRQLVREKSNPPAVGFCGHDTPIPSLLKGLAKRALGRPAMSSRGQAMRRLAADGRIESRFVVRPAFFGGSVVDGRSNYELMRRVRLEYVENMLGADYALAARGAETWGKSAGNFSYRLYEILSAGRPPLFVNTDCVLPYDDQLDWKSFTIWVDESDLRHIADTLVRFHESLSAAEFVDLQRECRRVWLEYLSPQGFFRNLHRHFTLPPS